MVQKRFYLDERSYEDKLKKVLEDEGEKIEISKTAKHHKIEFYHIKRTNTQFMYNGKKGIVMRANTETSIRRTKSRLEKLSGINITEIKND